MLKNLNKEAPKKNLKDNAKNPAKEQASGFAKDHAVLLSWYLENRRPLPWRASKDPYRIWISEVMLQQTTVTAVVPFYENFMRQFPDVPSLAAAPLSKVLEAWAGLGYYSRARNLHACAQKIAQSGFPKDHLALADLPGLGPYTSRAIASIAFDQAVGVLDGNVIRVLSRKYGIQSQWWQSRPRNELQAISDSLAKNGQSADFNQAMMELGATVCTPQSPNCILCPWNKKCVARDQDMISQIPLSKPRRASEFWLYEVEFYQRKNQVQMNPNWAGPFLKGQWMFPGRISKLKKKPKSFDLRHSITHHDIYIQIPSPKRVTAIKDPSAKWVEIENIKQLNPSSILQKIIQLALKDSSQIE